MKTSLLYTSISKNHLAINDEKQTTMKYVDDTSIHIFSPLKNRSINSQQYRKLFGIPSIIAQCSVYFVQKLLHCSYVAEDIL